MAQTIFWANEEATVQWGEQWAQKVAHSVSGILPLVMYLSGDLGAGKTTFVRGLLRGLGYTGSVKSPTYALVESYDLDLAERAISVHHFDLYRFRSPEEWEDAGLDDVISGCASWVLIEWAQQGGDYVPPADCILELKPYEQGRQATLHALTEKGNQVLALWEQN